MLEDFLLQVTRPARYIGQEWNASKKKFDEAGIKFALCFPDLYEVGMSNLGLRILYGLLNSMSQVICERFFSCDIDMERMLRSRSLQISSLESKKKLREFDLAGFSLGSELGFTNVLNILDLSAMPLMASERDHTFPLVIAGGPAALNPEPMYEFFDLFIIGEAEEVICELIDAYRENKQEYKNSRISKEDLLYKFSQIEGVYVPSLYEVTYQVSGAIKEFTAKIKTAPFKIKKRIVKDLNNSFFPVDWLVPYIQIIHDRIILEVMRGCPNNCRFCQARSQYYPFRQRDMQNILRIAQDSYARTGYEEISLCGLSVGQHKDIKALLENLIEIFQKKAIGISLPSIKERAMLGELFSLIAKIKKTGMTFAPEAGTQRLRKAMNKDFNEDDFFKALSQAFSSGYQRLKLYFMIGLPFEEDDDLDGIIDFSNRASELKRRFSGSAAQVNLSINAMIPKPHTPLQWFAMQQPEAIKDKQDYLKDKLKNRRLKLNFHDFRMSFLEGVLSRGDRRLSRVICRAFKKGARFDAWGNHFNFDLWLQAFKEEDLDPLFFLREKSRDEFLPWDFIDIGIDRVILVAEFDKTVAMK